MRFGTLRNILGDGSTSAEKKSTGWHKELKGCEVFYYHSKANIETERWAKAQRSTVLLQDIS